MPTPKHACVDMVVPPQGQEVKTNASGPSSHLPLQPGPPAAADIGYAVPRTEFANSEPWKRAISKHSHVRGHVPQRRVHRCYLFVSEMEPFQPSLSIQSSTLKASGSGPYLVNSYLNLPCLVPKCFDCPKQGLFPLHNDSSSPPLIHL